MRIGLTIGSDRERPRGERLAGLVAEVRSAEQAAATPPPYAPDLERAWMPDHHDIAEAIRRLAAV